MAWEHLSINRPHLVYIILGGFTSIFMLCSLFIKEKLYIGEATVATICGIIFGPHGANLINPLEWGNTDLITLEFSRIVLVVQCFAIGVELPKSYMERHWRSVVFLLIPVMTWGWLSTSLFIWWMVEPLSWLDSLIVAACVTATDPVLASSVVGKGKFAKRIPKHLRDILSAESGCNDGMAFPFIYLSVYISRYRPDANKVALHWFCFTILYECLVGAIYGFTVGYLARHAIKLAERKGLIDRESFLVFYFVLALFCAGSGSMLGMDDLLIGFSAGVGFSNDGWFTAKTEESHVSNVIDLLLNLTYFVYFGTVIPWDQFNAPAQGMIPWKLVVIGVFVIFFRRIPAMLALKPLIPDVKTWREALFAGHFGPIGVGAIFAAILTRAELETESTEPLSVLPGPEAKNYNVIYLIWPITCFLVIISIAIHGSSIAVFTLGKRINTMTLTLSYTQDNEAGRSWMDRLPRISTTNSKSISKSESLPLESESNEQLAFPPGTLGPTGVPGAFLRRQRDEQDKHGTPPMVRSRAKRRWDAGKGPGGPISQSAIEPQRSPQPAFDPSTEAETGLLGEKADGRQLTSAGIAEASSSTSPARSEEERLKRSAEIEVYEEGDDIIVEDKDGNVLSTTDTGGLKPANQQYVKGRREGVGSDVEPAVTHPYQNLKRYLGKCRGLGTPAADEQGEQEVGQAFHQTLERKRGPAHAYQFGNTIIVEDKDGEVIKTYSLPAHDKHKSVAEENSAQGRRKMSHSTDMLRGLGRIGNLVGIHGGRNEVPGIAEEGASGVADDEKLQAAPPEQKDTTGVHNASVDRHDESADFFADPALRLTISHIDRHGHGLSGASGTTHANGITTGSGRRYSAMDFVKELQQMDPKAQIDAINDSNAPDPVKRQMKRVAGEDESATESMGPQPGGRRRRSTLPSGFNPATAMISRPADQSKSGSPEVVDLESVSRPRTFATPTLVSEADEDEDDTAETAAERRRRLGALGISQERPETESDNDYDDIDAQNKSSLRHDQRRPRSGSTTELTATTAASSTNKPAHPRASRPEPEPESTSKPRVQWGGVSRRETTASEADKSSDAKGNGSGGSRTAAIRGLFGKN
jgi:sodium/hydrogen antiporter